MSAFLFTSCEEDEKEITPDVICDAYIKVLKDGDQSKYALFARAYSNYVIDNANVKTPSEKTIDLGKQDLSPYFFSFYTDEIDEFSEEIPAEGDYTFSVNSKDGISLTRVNKVTEEVAEVPVVTLCELTKTELNIKWEESKTADFFIIRLYDKNNKLIFSKEYIKNEKTVSDTITNNSKGWYEDNYLADAVSIKLMAVILENKLNPDLFYIQSIAETSKDIEE